MINGETAFLVVFGGLVFTAFATVLLWHILHFILCNKYDATLFRQPYFRINELSVYTVWPFSLIRSMGYIMLLGAPSLAKKRRFKDVKIDTSNQILLVTVCRLFIVLIALGIIFLLTLIIWGALV